jgi:lysyl endopeptidase
MLRIRKFYKLSLLAVAALVGVILAGHGSAKALSTATPVYRLYNTSSGLHLFTADSYEASVLPGNPTWKTEAPSFQGHFVGGNGSCDVNEVPVYRIVNPRSSEHLLTADTAEVDFWTQRADNPRWYSEGIAFCAYGAPVAGTVPVYRLWNTVSGEHLLTADTNEVNALNGHHNWYTETNRGGIVFWAQQ